MTAAGLITAAAMASEAVVIGTATVLEAVAARLRAAHERNPAVVAFRRHRAAQVNRVVRAPHGADGGTP